MCVGNLSLLASLGRAQARRWSRCVASRLQKFGSDFCRRVFISVSLRPLTLAGENARSNFWTHFQSSAYAWQVAVCLQPPILLHRWQLACVASVQRKLVCQRCSTRTNSLTTFA